MTRGCHPEELMLDKQKAGKSWTSLARGVMFLCGVFLTVQEGLMMKYSISVIAAVLLALVGCGDDPVSPDPDPSDEITKGPWSGSMNFYEGSISFTVVGDSVTDFELIAVNYFNTSDTTYVDTLIWQPADAEIFVNDFSMPQDTIPGNPIYYTRINGSFTQPDEVNGDWVVRALFTTPDSIQIPKTEIRSWYAHPE